MYHPERFNETLGEIGRGFYKFTDKIYPSFLPHTPYEISEDPAKVYRPKTFEGIYRHRHQLRKGKVIIPREERLQQKYRDVLASLKEEEATSLDRKNTFIRRMTESLDKEGVLIDRNWYPYRIPDESCMQFSVWYRADTSIYDRAWKVATTAYMDGLDPEDLAIWINVPRDRSVPEIGHAQLIVKRYPEVCWPLFQHLSVRIMHGDIYGFPDPLEDVSTMSK